MDRKDHWDYLFKINIASRKMRLVHNNKRGSSAPDEFWDVMVVVATSTLIVASPSKNG